MFLGAMADPGARSRTHRRTAGRTAWCARAAATGSTNTEHRKTASCAKVAKQDQTQSPMPSWNLPVGPVAASVSMPSSQRVSTCSRRILRQGRWLRCPKRPGGTMCLPAPGYVPPDDRESFRHSSTMVDKAGQIMRNIEKRARRWRQRSSRPEKALVSAEQNRDGGSKKPVPQDPAGTFCSSPFWLPSGRCLRREARGSCGSSKQQGRQR